MLCISSKIKPTKRYDKHDITKSYNPDIMDALYINIVEDMTWTISETKWEMMGLNNIVL